MNDLIERLRLEAATGWVDDTGRLLMNSAADAIEKLEAENAQLKAELGDLPEAQADMLSEIKRLKAELAQLRDQKPIGYIYLGGAIDAVGCVVRETAFSGELAIYAAPGANHG